MTKRPYHETLFEFHDGLHLKDTVLWFDSPIPRQLCFVSDAGVAGASVHQKVVTTDHTVKLLHALNANAGRGKKQHEPHALVSPYGRSFSIGQLSLELFPSGYVLGASSLFVKHQGVEIVYAGHVNPRQSITVPQIQARPCHVLLLIARFSERSFVFPPADETLAALVRFVRNVSSRGGRSVIFCPPLGEAQEVLRALQQAELPVRAHRRIAVIASVYREAGLLLDEVKTFGGALSVGESLIWPIERMNSSSLSKLEEFSTAVVSGIAADKTARDQLRCDASFPISAHADYPGLLEYVKVCRPETVILLGGASGGLQDDLRAFGMRVATVGPPRQMELFW